MTETKPAAGLSPQDEDALLKRRSELVRMRRLLGLGTAGVNQVRSELLMQISRLDYLLLRVPRERDGEAG